MLLPSETKRTQFILYCSQRVSASEDMNSSIGFENREVKNFRCFLDGNGYKTLHYNLQAYILIAFVLE